MEMSKEQLDKLTDTANKVGALCLASLSLSNCPIEEFYVLTENFLKEIEDLRDANDLQKLIPDEVRNAMFQRSKEDKKKDEKIGSDFSFSASPNKSWN